MTRSSSQTTMATTSTTMTKTRRMSSKTLHHPSPHLRPSGGRSEKRICPSPLSPPLHGHYRRKCSAATGDDSCRERNRNAHNDTTQKVALLREAYTTLDEPGIFDGVRRPFVRRFDRRNTQCYLCTQGAYTLHKQVKRHFPRRKTYSKAYRRPLPFRSR